MRGLNKMGSTKRYIECDFEQNPDLELEAVVELLNYIHEDVSSLNPLAGSGVRLAIEALKGADFKECLSCITLHNLEEKRSYKN